ncbi:T9SS type B sorting domain-containing protein [Brumimicrobium glaciale]|uniref:T9SS type B sorting domain-containing protein n=1 Tax=Brumimicrobium glaciale TaxID=200475 RepID=A0A4Q4KEF8_9FLAO|nr:PKD domain-containing protein [Brumimicrobium glaciale]RYM31315.1 T9SS type B sorting domain-containing protein [Brumimicrobium glaciale]
MKLIITILLLTFSYWSYSQCTVTIQTATDSVDCGGCFDLTAVGIAQDTLLYESFDNGALGPGWAANQPVMFNNPCGAPPNGSPTAWFGNLQGFPRYVETIDYDLTCGGDVCWLMMYAEQGSSGGINCEGPDLPTEGVKLQYSINGGVSWVQIVDYPPLNNGYDPFQTAWNEYCEPIPLAAQTASTRFRWVQLAATTANTDHWGIDDVAVLGTICGTYYYDWNADGTTNLPDTNICITQNTETYNVIYTDGVQDTCYASIDMFAVMYPNLPNDTSFCGYVDLDIVSNPTGGTGTYDFLWNNGDTDNTIEDATTNIYYVDIVDGTYPGCTASDTIDFGMHPIPVVNFSASPLCQGALTNFIDSTVLPPGFNIDTWSWNFNNQGATSTLQNPSHLFSGVGTYNVKLKVTTEFGCVGDTTITYFIEPSPYSDFEFSAACEGEETEFTNESIGNFENSQWIFTSDTDTILSTDATFTFPGSGNYDVTLIIEDANGDCVSTSTQTVVVNPSPDVTFTADPMFGEPALNVNFFSDPSGLVDNFWDFNDGNSTAELNDTIFNSFLEAGVYDVTHTGTSADGCTNTYTMQIVVEYPEVLYDIPNVFTPNNDGINDGFFINYLAAYETITDFEIVILNRWGATIRRYSEANFIWDGKSKSGTVVGDGTYFYKVNFKTVKGKNYEEHGFVQVVND